jgi:ribonuclease P protein component
MAEEQSFRFRPHEHLRRPADFKLVYDRRRSAADEWIIVYVRENGLPHLRLGMSVSRKFGSAVKRNRVRRLYREAFRLTKHAMPVGLDIVVIPRRSDYPQLTHLQGAFPQLVQSAACNL